MPTKHLTHELLAQYARQYDRAETLSIVEGNLNRVHDRYAVAGILRWLSPMHLPPHLQETAIPFAVLAVNLVDECADTAAPAELATALRKIVEAKDCAVRAAIASPSVASAPEED